MGVIEETPEYILFQCRLHPIEKRKVALDPVSEIEDEDLEILEHNYPKRILSNVATIPRYNNNSEIRYSSQFETIIKKMGVGALKEILAKFAPIMKSNVRRDVYFWFLDNQGGIPNMLFADLEANEGHIYKEINWLRKNNFIEASGPVRVFKKSGPKPILYTLPDTPKETIPKMIIKVQQSYTKIYKVSRDLAQRIFDELKDEEIQFSKITDLAKKNSQGFYFLDVANIAAEELHNQGIKVWR